MRRIINSTYMSLDGVIQNPQDWAIGGAVTDGTAATVQTNLLLACDAVLMGSATYEVMAGTWMPRSGDPYSDRINSMKKYVISSRLHDPEWTNTEIISDDPIEKIRALKDRPGLDIVQYGFGEVSYAMLEHGLLDELRLWLHPLFVGDAAAADLLFRPSVEAHLKLVDSLTLSSGIVILTYETTHPVGPV